ncbi:MAG: TRAP transporter large permease [Pseudomonadota bacterium]
MGERELVGIAGLVVFFVLLMLRMPVGLAMLAVGIGGNYAISLVAPFLRFEPYLRGFKTLTWSTMASYELSVVPLFVLMGLLASHARLSRDLFNGVNALVGRLRGGVAIAAIGACAGFGAVSGSSLATASTMGRVALPELKRLRYDDRLATGSLAAGGTLGILIPPSIALVIYAIIVEASIIEMFQAAIVPGVIAVAGFALTIAVLVRVNPGLAPEVWQPAQPERRRAVLRLIPVAVIFGAIILGLGLGLFTPTPAAAVGAGLVLIYGIGLQLVTGDGLTLERIKASLLETAITSAMIYFILFGAEVLKGFFTRANLPTALADWAVSSGLDPWTILILMLIALIVLGCFMESLAMILVVVPFFWPALVQLNGGEYAFGDSAAFGMDSDQLRIWFGILALVVVELGLITPPVGLNVFIIASLARGVSMGTIFRGVAPFFGAEIVRVALILMFPALALWLPALLSG